MRFIVTIDDSELEDDDGDLDPSEMVQEISGALDDAGFTTAVVEIDE